jgi:hypothetical protein
MANTVTVAATASTVTISATGIDRCATALVVRSGESRTVDGTKRRDLLRLESDASVALATDSGFIFGC